MKKLNEVLTSLKGTGYRVKISLNDTDLVFSGYPEHCVGDRFYLRPTRRSTAISFPLDKIRRVEHTNKLYGGVLWEKIN